MKDMIEKIKILLGGAEASFTDAQIQVCLEGAIEEVKNYCNREDIDTELKSTVQKIAIIRLNRINSEGLTAQSYSGVSESYVDGYPQDIMLVLNRKRKLKII